MAVPDLIFLQGKEVVLKMALVLLANHKELIKQCIGFESIVEFLKTTLPEMGIIQLERVINEVSRFLYDFSVICHQTLFLRSKILFRAIRAHGTTLMSISIAVTYSDLAYTAIPWIQDNTSCGMHVNSQPFAGSHLAHPRVMATFKSPF